MSNETKNNPDVEEQEANQPDQPKQLDPQAFSYRPDGKVEMSAEVFEIMRAYMREQVQKNPPVKYFQATYPAIVKKKVGKKTENVIESKPYETDEDYKNQTPLDLRSVESFNAVYVTNLLEGTHVDNIEKGNAVAKEVLQKEHQEAQNKMKKVEE